MDHFSVTFSYGVEISGFNLKRQYFLPEMTVAQTLFVNYNLCIDL